MCGISGYLSSKDLLSKNNIKTTLKLMKKERPRLKWLFQKRLF